MVEIRFLCPARPAIAAAVVSSTTRLWRIENRSQRTAICLLHVWERIGHFTTGIWDTASLQELHHQWLSAPQRPPFDRHLEMGWERNAFRARLRNNGRTGLLSRWAVLVSCVSFCLSSGVLLLET